MTTTLSNAEILEDRCKVTKNPVGTDTWPDGLECPCEPCQRYVHPEMFTARAQIINRCADIADRFSYEAALAIRKLIKE